MQLHSVYWLALKYLTLHGSMHSTSPAIYQLAILLLALNPFVRLHDAVPKGRDD